MQLLRSLSPVEQNRFIRFVRSPYFNPDERLVRLAEYFLERLEQPPSREQLFEAMFPGEEYDYFQISNLCSYLTRLMRRYLAIEEMQHGWEEETALIRAVHAKQLEKLFSGESRRWEKALFRKGHWVPDDHFMQYQIERERNEFFLRQRSRRVDNSLQNQMLHLNRFYVLSMLKSVCQFLNRSSILQLQGLDDITQNFVEDVVRHADAYEDHPLIPAYLSVLQSQMEPGNPRHYRKLLAILDKSENRMPSNERTELYQYARNHCIRRSNQGESQFLVELLGIYKRMAELDQSENLGLLSHPDVKNIVSLGIRLGELDWTEAFLEEFVPRLAPDQQENARLYNLAHLLHSRGEYRQAMRLLTQVEFEDVFYFWGAKTLLLKIYFELEEEDALQALLHAFDVALQRNKRISDVQRASHSQLVRFTRRLSNLRSRPDPQAEDFSKLLEEIRQKPGISQKSWLIDRCQQIISRT